MYQLLRREYYHVVAPPMRVTSEILEDVLGATQWWLGVNDPVGFPYRSQIPGKSAGVLKWFKRVEETQVPGVKGGLQLRQKQSAKQS